MEYLCKDGNEKNICGVLSLKKTKTNVDVNVMTSLEVLHCKTFSHPGNTKCVFATTAINTFKCLFAVKKKQPTSTKSSSMSTASVWTSLWSWQGTAAQWHFQR